jgi:sigma54-dependent transcription regulator
MDGASRAIRVESKKFYEMGHDRDVNAAKNILAAGHRRLAAGIPVF